MLRSKSDHAGVFGKRLLFVAMQMNLRLRTASQHIDGRRGSMKDEMVPFIFGLMIGSVLTGVFVIGLCSVALEGLREANKRCWSEAISRGYAERVQTEAGDPAFRWRDK